MILRAALVGVNFGVMLWLAAVLGLAGFGKLAFLWGLALLFGTLLSWGGPLVLLRQVDSRHWAPARMLQLVVVLPAVGAVIAYWPLTYLFPDVPWAVILACALGVNGLSCLASVLRGLGSVAVSMVLRDGAPQILLAIAVIAGGGDVVTLLAGAAVLMAILCLGMIGILLWSLRGTATGHMPALPRAEVAALWGNTVLGVAVAQIDLIIGGLLFPPEVLGLYALLRRVANLVALPVSVATWVSAGPITAAVRDNNNAALQVASTTGSLIAIIPGAALFIAGLFGIAALPWVLPASQTGTAQMVFPILLCGAFIQVCFAAGFPVATLSGQARDAACARLGVVIFYLCGVGVTYPLLGIVSHAVVYVAALSVGSLWLWYRMLKCFAVETSARAVLRLKMAS